MAMGKKRKKLKLKSGRVLDTISDVGGIFMAIIYTLYVSLLLIFNMGTRWLNWVMLVITFLYIAFFITKIVVLNRMLETKVIQKKTKLALKYSKWSMKIINAAFVIAAIATTTGHSDGSVMMMVGVFIVGTTFIISLAWDILWRIVSKKLREFRIGWDNLSQKEKNDRIQSLIESFLSNIDDIAGVDLRGVALIPGASSQEEKTQDRRGKHQAQLKEGPTDGTEYPEPQPEK